MNRNQESYFFEFEESEYGKAAKELGWKTDFIREKLKLKKQLKKLKEQKKN